MLTLVARWIASDQGGIWTLHVQPHVQPQGHVIDHALCHMISETQKNGLG